MKRHPKHKNNREQGSVLLVVLWTVAILSLLALGAGYQSFVEAKLNGYQVDRLKEKRLCVAGIELAKSVLKENTSSNMNSNRPWINNPDLFRDLELTDGRVTIHRQVAVDSDSAKVADLYALVDEEGKVNLNTASLKVLKSLPGISEEIAKSILAWRGSELDSSANASEDIFYKGLSHPYPRKKKPFESVEEILLVRGMTPDLFDAIQPYVTVYSEGRVNINTADGKVLLALGLGQELVNKILQFRKGSDGQEWTSDDRQFEKTDSIASKLNAFFPLSADEVAKIQNLVSLNMLSVDSHNYRVNLDVCPGNSKISSSYGFIIGSGQDNKKWVVKHCIHLS